MKRRKCQSVSRKLCFLHHFRERRPKQTPTKRKRLQLVKSKQNVYNGRSYSYRMTIQQENIWRGVWCVPLHWNEELRLFSRMRENQCATNRGNSEMIRHGGDENFSLRGRNEVSADWYDQGPKDHITSNDKDNCCGKRRVSLLYNPFTCPATVRYLQHSFIVDWAFVRQVAVHLGWFSKRAGQNKCTSLKWLSSFKPWNEYSPSVVRMIKIQKQESKMHSNTDLIKCRRTTTHNAQVCKKKHKSLINHATKNNNLFIS